MSVDQYLNDKKKKDEKRYESFIRESAESIFQQYLGDLSCDIRSDPNSNKLTFIHPDTRRQLGLRIAQETISQHWFDEVQKGLFDILESEFLTRFKADSSYSKMLAELEIFKEDEFVATETGKGGGFFLLFSGSVKKGAIFCTVLKSDRSFIDLI